VVGEEADPEQPERARQRRAPTAQDRQDRDAEVDRSRHQVEHDGRRHAQEDSQVVNSPRLGQR
jgi:hypothetical protein